MSENSHTAEDLGQLQRRVIRAQDAQIQRIVALVDALPARGDADRLLAPLRPRLAQLRPARPLRFCRLLFRPLDPLIVPAPKWRPTSFTFPRTLLEPLAASVREAMNPDIRAAVDAVIAQRTTHDAEAVRKAGTMLWPAAAETLCAGISLRAWRTTGLPISKHSGLARAAGAVILHGVALHEIAEASRDRRDPDERQIETLLQKAATHGPETVSRILAVLLDSMPHAGAMVLALAGAGFREDLLHGHVSSETSRGIGGRIYAARQERRWTQRALADAVGVSRSAIAQWETDRALGLPENLTRLATALGTSVDWLVHGNKARALTEAASQEELSILELYRRCSTYDRRVVRDMMQRLAGRMRHPETYRSEE
ncbi:MAG: helix-turn-helix transcriptional regulator [Acetobacteraceae bacterium]|nr:helix-turn-helix transcriptional regulator [Acetobacteraceae bacterium]